MHTTYLETVCASISVVTTRCHTLGVGPQMNKFEQISSDHHQMSLVGKGLQVSCPGTGEGDTLPGNLSYDAFDVTYPLPPQNDREKPVKTLPSHNLVCRRKKSNIKTYAYPITSRSHKFSGFLSDRCFEVHPLKETRLLDHHRSPSRKWKNLF